MDRGVKITARRKSYRDNYDRIFSKKEGKEEKDETRDDVLELCKEGDLR